MRFAAIPLTRKLVIVMVVTTAAALILASLAFVSYEALSYRRGAIQHARALGAITAASSAGALAFNDRRDAGATLAALSAERQVLAAALYDLDHTLFAAYPTSVEPEDLPAEAAEPHYAFGDRTLEYVTPVMHGDARLGTLYLRVDTSDLYRTSQLLVAITTAVLLFALFLAFVIARRMQRHVSGPILALSSVARAVSDQRDYSVRAEPVEQPEIRILTDAFNQMLGRIEETQSRLKAQLGRLDLLQRTTRAIGERGDLPSILQVIVGRLESELPVDFACVARFIPQERVLVVESVGTRAAAIAHLVGMQLNERIPLDHNGLERCTSGELVYEPDLRAVPQPFAKRLVRADLLSFVAAPLTSKDSIWGVLIAARAAPVSFSSTDTEFLGQLSDHASLAVRQIQLTDDLRRAYEDLRQSQLTIAQQERLRALGQMASGIAHDINNAISPVSLYVATLLEQESTLSSRGRAHLATIQRAIDDVTHTVQRMREFYRRGDARLDFAPVDLNAVCRQVIELTRARWSNDAQERGAYVELRAELAFEPVWVRGLDGEIRDALVNLVLNAVDAMPSGGVLTIRTSNRVPAASSETRTSEHPVREQNSCADFASVEVCDTGTGMDELTRSRCIEPFFTTKGERGTGMGLAMVYGMVQRHGGQAEIESASGAGTTVRLLLPRSNADEITIEASPARPRAQAQPLSVLVVDDDPLLIQSLRDTLELEGHFVTVADGGQSGIDAFVAAQSRGERLDAVITDLGMPHLDGRAVAAAVKALDPDTTVILLTGWGARLLAEHDVPTDVDRILAKPPRLKELREMLATVSPRTGPIS